jgi:hypothetical protein
MIISTASFAQLLNGMVLRPSNSRKRHNIQRREKAATKETKKKKNNKKLSDIQKAICIVDISAFEE